MVEKKSGWFRQAKCFSIFGVAMLILSACAATGTRIKAYDGPELSETATLKAPENIKVLSINGQSMTSFLLDDLSLNYSLRPGQNRIVYKYRSIWSKSGVRENDESAVDVVESDRVEAAFVAQADETYSFRVGEAENVREARRLASDFSAPVVNGSGQVVATSTDLSGPARSVAPVSPPETNEVTSAATAPDSTATLPSNDSGPGQDSAVVAPGMSTVDALNLLWERATREEKEAFLRQAFE